VRGIEPAVLALLEGYPWPGNVRELENELQRAVSMTPRGGTIGVDQISPKVQGDVRAAGTESEDAPMSLRGALRPFERDHLKRALAASAGNVSHAARALGISRVQLQRKMKALGLRTARPSDHAVRLRLGASVTRQQLLRERSIQCNARSSPRNKGPRISHVAMLVHVGIRFAFGQGRSSRPGN
jgi:hypothetical protein